MSVDMSNDYTETVRQNFFIFFLFLNLYELVGLGIFNATTKKASHDALVLMAHWIFELNLDIVRQMVC